MNNLVKTKLFTINNLSEEWYTVKGIVHVNYIHSIKYENSFDLYKELKINKYNKDTNTNLRALAVTKSYFNPITTNKKTCSSNLKFFNFFISADDDKCWKSNH